MSKELQKHYMRRFMVSMFAYVATILSSVYYLKDIDIGVLERFIAVTPMIPIVFATISLVKAVREMDELEQRIQKEATVTAAIIVGLLTFTYGFLEGVGFPRLEVIWILPSLLACQGLAKIAITRSYL